jgi:hypothetical protein
MRRTVRDLLVGTSALTAIVPAARWYAPGNVLDRPPKPFVVLRWLAPVASNTPTRHLRQLRVDVHDERGSYARIDALLGNPDTGTGVWAVLAPLSNHVGADGRIAATDYLGHSGDQEDITYNTNMKFSSWQMIGVDL